MHLQEIAEREPEEAGIRSVHQTNTVPARLYVKIRRELAVCQHDVAVHLRNPWSFRVSRDGIFQLTVGPEKAVEEQKGYLILSLGQVQRVLRLIPNHEQS